ncbi:hypothetical protein SD70_28125 [Gordoniibacillus kamchatkensis]|uniref:Uncharacterized protein n=1 Tax=Gordoniibacillus kamchatkensis TaxID=1590651 RepID=A0ABR5ABD9_9BACL|nr:hypothetical protein SD70_28125 [Paenibacillus sp. VKM B-2647]
MASDVAKKRPKPSIPGGTLFPARNRPKYRHSLYFPMEQAAPPKMPPLPSAQPEAMAEKADTQIITQAETPLAPLIQQRQ